MLFQHGPSNLGALQVSLSQLLVAQPEKRLDLGACADIPAIDVELIDQHAKNPGGAGKGLESRPKAYVDVHHHAPMLPFCLHDQQMHLVLHDFQYMLEAIFIPWRYGMELRHLRYFATVAEEGHITRAAERLGIQQPPLSKQIRLLEDEIGARLFRRTPRGVVLTDVGAVFLEDAQKVLIDTERAVARARRTARGEAGRVVVGLTSSATFYPLIQRIIRGFRETVPGVSLEFREMASAEQVEALISEDLDVGFVRTKVPKEAGIAVYPLIEEPMLAAFPDGHRLGRPDDGPLPLGALANEPFVLYRRSTGAGLYDAIIAACNAAGFVPRTEQEAPWIGATLNLVAAGLGVTIVPVSFNRMQLDGVVYRRLEDRPNLKARIDLACRRTDRSAVTDAFVSFVRAQAKDSAGDEPTPS